RKIDAGFRGVSRAEALLAGGVEGAEGVPVAQEAEVVGHADGHAEVAQAGGDRPALREVARGGEGAAKAGDGLLPRQRLVGGDGVQDLVNGVEAELRVL